jgi:Suppressor of fused protein (SUFU)
MNSDKNSNAVSQGGSPILQHAEESPWTAPQGEECIEAISNHIETHLAPIETVFHEIMSDTVHIDIHFVKPTPDFPYVRLITSGMSDLPMSENHLAGLPPR